MLVYEKDSRREYFRKVKDISCAEFLSFIENAHETNHCRFRKERLEALDQTAVPVEHFIAIVDKKHENGYEVHAFYSDGTIRIYNYKTHKFITALFARVPQLERIRDKRFLQEIPRQYLSICRKNKIYGRNHW